MVTNVLDSIQLEVEQLSAGKVSSPFNVPEGYFEQLTTAVLSAIHTDDISSRKEIESLSPLLSGIQSHNIFRVPEGYFENLSINMNTPAKAVLAPVVRFRKPAFLRYAAAAVISGVLGLSLFSVFNNNASTHPGYSAGVMKEATAMVNENSFDEAFKTLSASDIEQYLQQSGQDVEAALVASVTEEPAKLPAADDYILDENALDNFLNDMNLNN
ncbi:MAG: hypothetical protein ABIT96_10640 [Ferruginibacter sp.]